MSLYIYQKYQSILTRLLVLLRNEYFLTKKYNQNLIFVKIRTNCTRYKIFFLKSDWFYPFFSIFMICMLMHMKCLKFLCFLYPYITFNSNETEEYTAYHKYYTNISLYKYKSLTENCTIHIYFPNIKQAIITFDACNVEKQTCL